LEYRDHNPGQPDGDKEIWLFDRDGTGLFLLRVEVVGSGKKQRVEYHVVNAPFQDHYDLASNYGVHYGPDGRMNPIRNVKGLPRIIDLDATVEAFLRQVAAGQFTPPALIRPKQKKLF
jgi:hypothetical protein